jgi:hypothetical protein
VLELRFIEEYRGRRIVTNGTFYGVHQEPVTDYRYLTLKDARAGINSEVAIELRKNRATMRAEYFGDYKTRPFTCECGWHGRYKNLRKEEGAAVILSCPTCARRLLFVPSPSHEDISKAAARGNKEARAMMRGVRER